MKSVSITVATTDWGTESSISESYKLKMKALEFISVSRGNCKPQVDAYLI